MKKEIEAVEISVEGRPWRRVARADYVKAKTQQLQEFGYPSLTQKEVDEQITAIQKGLPLNVIGMFMEREVR